MCDKFLLEGKCLDPTCKWRHPKNCKFWSKDSRGFFWGDSCKYLHKIGDKCKGKIEVEEASINAVIKESLHKAEDTLEINETMEISVVGETSDKGDEKNTVIKLKETLISKELSIKDFEANIMQLSTDKADLINQLDRLKKVLPAMANKIKKFEANQKI